VTECNCRLENRRLPVESGCGTSLSFTKYVFLHFFLAPRTRKWHLDSVHCIKSDERHVAAHTRIEPSCHLGPRDGGVDLSLTKKCVSFSVESYFTYLDTKYSTVTAATICLTSPSV
jgi:hypothetical protein